MQKERKSETFIRWLTGAGIKHEVKVEIDDTFSAWKTTTTEVVVDFDNPRGFVQVFFSLRTPKVKGKRTSESVFGFTCWSWGKRTKLFNICSAMTSARILTGQL